MYVCKDNIEPYYYKKFVGIVIILSKSVSESFKLMLSWIGIKSAYAWKQLL